MVLHSMVGYSTAQHSISMRLLHAGSKPLYKADSRRHALQDPHVHACYVPNYRVSRVSMLGIVIMILGGYLIVGYFDS